MVGDGMSGMALRLEWGDLQRVGQTRAGVSALVVVKKRRNGRGAKGGRKVDA